MTFGFFQHGDKKKNQSVRSTKPQDIKETTPEKEQNGTIENISKLDTSPGSKRRQIPFVDTKYTKDSFQYLKVIGKGSFGKVIMLFFLIVSYKESESQNETQ